MPCFFILPVVLVHLARIKTNFKRTLSKGSLSDICKKSVKKGLSNSLTRLFIFQSKAFADDSKNKH